MPTYEYSCQKCGHHFESVHSMTAPALTQCPKEVCPGKKWGRGKVKRGVGGGTGLIFKGSGFYITDYRSEGYKSAAKQDSAGGSTAPAAPADAKSAPAAPASTPAPAAPAAPSAAPAKPSKPSGGDKK